MVGIFLIIKATTIFVLRAWWGPALFSHSFDCSVMFSMSHIGVPWLGGICGHSPLALCLWLGFYFSLGCCQHDFWVLYSSDSASCSLCCLLHRFSHFWQAQWLEILKNLTQTEAEPSVLTGIKPTFFPTSYSSSSLTTRLWQVGRRWWVLQSPCPWQSFDNWKNRKRIMIKTCWLVPGRETITPLL